MSVQSQIKAYYRKHSLDRIIQGDILRDITMLEWEMIEGERDLIEKILPYVIVLTQDCDLEQDFFNRNEQREKQDKFLQSILVCPAYLSKQFRDGIHLKSLNLQMEKINSGRYKAIQNQNIGRYHYLEGSVPDQVPELVIDFKHYYTLPANLLNSVYKQHYVASLNELFRESLSQRFSFYLSRIGLPKIV